MFYTLYTSTLLQFYCSFIIIVNSKDKGTLNFFAVRYTKQRALSSLSSSCCNL